MDEAAKTPRAILHSRLMACPGRQRGEFHRVQQYVPLHDAADNHVAEIAAAAKASLFGRRSIAEPELVVEVFDDQLAV
ncbi:MAG TPA: hypothetical protein VHW66_13710 [Stellaceae bacterium]|jgi:hypothetical protein|nr:hypothetical protein [Stellaceae bacterium]